MCYLPGRNRNESRLSNTENYLALPRNRKNSRLTNSIITNHNHRLIIGQSPAAPALLYPMILEQRMYPCKQTKIQCEIKTV